MGSGAWRRAPEILDRDEAAGVCGWSEDLRGPWISQPVFIHAPEERSRQIIQDLKIQR